MDNIELSVNSKKIVDFYKRFYNEAPVGLYRTSIKDGTFLKANPFLIHLLGYNSLEELKNEVKTSDLYHPQKRIELLNTIKNNNFVQDFEVEITLPKTKEKKWIAITAKMYDDYLEGSIMDITKRKQTETELCDLQKIILNMKEINKDINLRLQEYVIS